MGIFHIYINIYIYGSITHLPSVSGMHLQGEWTPGSHSASLFRNTAYSRTLYRFLWKWGAPNPLFHQIFPINMYIYIKIRQMAMMKVKRYTPFSDTQKPFRVGSSLKEAVFLSQPVAALFSLTGLMLLGLIGFRESPNGYDTRPGKRSNSLRTGKLPLLVGKSM